MKPADSVELKKTIYLIREIVKFSKKTMSHFAIFQLYHTKFQENEKFYF
jgi:hypothetical protein